MSKYEHLPYHELDPSVVQAYANTFIPRFDVFPMQLADGRYITRKKRLELDLVKAHLKGIMTLGAYALDEQSRARWVCLDADTPEQWITVQRLAADLQSQHLVPYLETSRRGGHLWLFFAPLPGSDARYLGQTLIRHYGLEGIELYPKQDVLKTGVGSLVRLPLGRHRRSGRRYHFITLEGKPLAPTIREQVELLSQPQRVPQRFIEHILRDQPTPEPATPTPTFERPTGEVPVHTLSERLKHRISVLDFVSQYVELDHNGTGFCPFHDDQHRSFGVSAEHNYWHCWAGCGGGSIIDFWMRWREAHGQDGSFTATVSDLAHRLL